MTADEFEAIPEAEWKVLATTEITHLTDEEKEHLPRAWDEWIARVRRDAAREALDGLDAAEHRATRAEAQSAIRGRAVAIYQARARDAEARVGRLENRAASETARANAWRDKHRIMAEKRNAAHRAWASENEARREAEARIKAVEDVLDNPIHLTDWDDPLVPAEHVRRALEG